MRTMMMRRRMKMYEDRIDWLDIDSDRQHLCLGPVVKCNSPNITSCHYCHHCHLHVTSIMFIIMEYNDDGDDDDDDNDGNCHKGCHGWHLIITPLPLLLLHVNELLDKRLT